MFFENFNSYYLSCLYTIGHHECEILGRRHEPVESEFRWNKCEKNPGHKEFISAKVFKDNYLSRVKTSNHRDSLRAVVDLTVRLRINWTSPSRPDGDKLSDIRGSNGNRLGTGFINYVDEPVSNEPCPCDECKSVMTKKFWRFKVRTAHHVVYDTTEAERTKVDLFYDDRSGRMKTVRGLKLVESKPDRDICYMTCVTHDAALGERIKASWCCWRDGSGEPLDLSGVDLLPSCDRGRHPTLIVSHPHGQPKKITVGEGSGESPRLEYNTATCPGSSGAPVFRFYPIVEDWRHLFLLTHVHRGSFTSTSTQDLDKPNLLTRVLHKLRKRETKLDQINYGDKW